jgi:membrane protease YdiL (CAAX protease family)
MLNVSDAPLPVPELYGAATSAGAAAEASTARPVVRDRRMRWLEVVVVTSVAFLYPLLGSIHVMLMGRPTSPVAGQYGFTMGLFLLCPPLLTLTYVLRRNGRTFRDIGLYWSWGQVGMGVLLMLAALFSTAIFGLLLRQVLIATGFGDAVRAAAESVKHAWTRSMLFTPSGALYLSIVPFFEEILVRAYLMTELIELTGSAAVAVVVSVLLQSSYHLYYGWVGATTIVFTFLPWALYFAKVRKALPTITAHWMYDMLIFAFKR